MRADRSRLPEPVRDPAFRFPSIVRHVLPNGLKVRTVEHGGVLGLRSLVYAVDESGDGPDRPVLDWRFEALHF